MNRRDLALLLLGCLTAMMAAADASDAGPRYNLLVIETDEHHYNTLGCYGGTIVGTPHIDRIAEEGARCTAFYATTPVCSPSRAALVSGLYPQKTDVTTNDIPLNDAVVTFAEILRQNGYTTGYAGKWHLDGTGKPQWAPERSFGFEDNRFMFNRGHWKRLIDTPDGPRVGATDNKGEPSYSLNGADDKTFTTDWLCDKAVAFIQEHAAQPFCCMVSLPDPHGPNTVRPPYDTMYDDVDVPIPFTLTRKPEQIPAWGKPTGVTPDQLRRLMRNYYGMVRCIDDNVGKLFRTLEEAGVLDHTIIVFTSDHGDLCGEHGRLNKGVPYEGSARIPFLLRCPGTVPPGTVVHEALSNIDFLPTVLNLMNVPLNHTVDGRNAAALFRGEGNESWDDIVFLRSTGSERQTTGWLAAVSQRYKLVYSTNEVPWLIDLREDPYELTNRYGNPELQPVVREMAAKLAEYARQHNDPHAVKPGLRSWISEAAGN